MEEKNEVGVEKLKKVLKAVIDLGGSIAEKSEGGLSIVEIVSLVAESFGKLNFVFVDFKAIAEEASDLDQNEWEELVDYFAEEFDIDNDLAEEKVEAAVDLLSAAIYFASLFLKEKQDNA